LTYRAPLTVVALMRSHPGRRTELETRIHTSAIASRKEPGCQSYELLEDTRDLDLIILIEIWTSRAAFTAHLDQPHLDELARSTRSLLSERPQVYELEHCSDVDL
jgi:quinol monooxygenase YgiN